MDDIETDKAPLLALNLGQTAEAIGVNRATYRALRREGNAPPERLIGGRRRLRRVVIEELNEWLKSQPLAA